MKTSIKDFIEELIAASDIDKVTIKRSICGIDLNLSDKEVVDIFSAVASAYIGKRYIVDNANRPVIIKVMNWLFGKSKLDLKKGIMLTGGTGKGKTTILNVLSHIAYGLGYQYELEGCRYPFHWNAVKAMEIVDAYIHGASLSSFVDMPILFIDSMGDEVTEVEYCGTRINVIQHILALRADRKDVMTFITARTENLNKLLNDYGPAMASWIEGMCNLITIGGKTDYRQCM